MNHATSWPKKWTTPECEEVKELDTRDVTEHEVDNDSNTTAANKQWQVSSQSQPPDQTTNKNKHQIQDLFLHLNWIMGKGESVDRVFRWNSLEIGSINYSFTTLSGWWEEEKFFFNSQYPGDQQDRSGADSKEGVGQRGWSIQQAKWYYARWAENS